MDTLLNKNINDEQKNALYKIVHNFYTVQKSIYPDMIKNEDAEFSPRGDLHHSSDWYE